MKHLVPVLTAFFSLGLAGEVYAQALRLDRPLRSVHLGGNWAANRTAVERWEDDRMQPLLPADYMEYLHDMHADWVGLSVALHIDDSLDSTVERAHSARIPTFSDEALRQIIREHRQHGFEFYLTLAIESFEAYEAGRPVQRFQLGDPDEPDTGVPHDAAFPAIRPEFWPWRPTYPDHDRFVAEFWATYTEQAVHFARIAQEEGVRMYSLGFPRPYPEVRPSGSAAVPVVTDQPRKSRSWSRVQTAGTTSVRAKSSPLNSKDSPVWRASAYAQQSPRFRPAG